MESTRLADESDIELDVEFEALVAEWYSQRDAEAAERTEVEEQLDALLEARAVMASMQAREQQCLARLGELALDEAGPRASGETREMAWRSMSAEIAVATKLADRTVQTMMDRAFRLVTRLPHTLD